MQMCEGGLVGCGCARERAKRLNIFINIARVLLFRGRRVAERIPNFDPFFARGATSIAINGQFLGISVTRVGVKFFKFRKMLVKIALKNGGCFVRELYHFCEKLRKLFYNISR